MTNIKFDQDIITIKEKNKQSEEISILFTGDFCPIGTGEKLIEQGKLKNLVSDLGDDFFKRDLAVINVEGPLIKDGIPIAKTGPNIKIHPDAVNFIKEGKFDLLSLANNHMGDFGPSKVNETTNWLDENKLAYVGAGKNLKTARLEKVFEIKGKKIAFVAYAEYEFGMATDSEAGAFPIDPVNNMEQITKLALKYDYVLVIVHGGNEHCPIPNDALVTNYRGFIRAGANGVIATHTHCPLGIEIYNECPIVYSTGNFLFDIPFPNKEFSSEHLWWKGYMVKLVFADDQALRLQVIPYTFYPNGTSFTLFQGEEKNKFLDYIAHISNIITDDAHRRLLFEAFSTTMGPYWIKYLGRMGLMRQIFRKKVIYELLVARNLFTCFAHYEVNKTYLRLVCENRVDEVKKYLPELKRLQKGLIT
ncbi:MAG: CapA family protein [Clostridiales bacterium]|nr:CapA family protein [Clostridiales bacterium]